MTDLFAQPHRPCPPDDECSDPGSPYCRCAWMARADRALDELHRANAAWVREVGDG